MFFVGLHQPDDARTVDRAFISAKRLARHEALCANDWVMDSGAFTEISQHGGYRSSVAEYARIIRRLAPFGNLLAAVAQDYMCEPHILRRTGKTVADHQRLTLDRYLDLRSADVGGAYIMPVLQGYWPTEYARHVAAYGDLLEPGAWVGVGSICKRQGAPAHIAQVLEAIHEVRPDLRLHGFGVKLTSLKADRVRQHLATADSMAWSFGARKNGFDQNDVWVAKHYELRVLGETGWPRGDYADSFLRFLIRHQFDRWQREAAEQLGVNVT